MKLNFIHQLNVNNKPVILYGFKVTLNEDL